MMNRLGHEQENVTKNIRNLFKLKKENQVIKDRIIRYIRNLFEHEEEKDCCKPVRVGNFWRNRYIDLKVIMIKIKLNQLNNFLTNH